MAAKFTPGPWTPQYDDNGFYLVDATQAPSPYIVATGGEGEADKANAYLIAAAPDLHDALERIIRYHSASISSDCTRAADRALAKAMGEQQ